MDKENPIKPTASRIAYQNPWLTVREDIVIKSDGGDGIYGVIETKDSVIVAAINENDEVYFINGFSYPTGVWGWWLPGGGGEGESPTVAGARELVEESGITASSWDVLGTTRVCNGLMTEKMSVLVAHELTMGEKPGADDDIMIKGGRFMSMDTINDMIKSGDIDDGQTIAALYLVQNWLGKN